MLKKIVLASILTVAVVVVAGLILAPAAFASGANQGNSKVSNLTEVILNLDSPSAATLAAADVYEADAVLQQAESNLSAAKSAEEAALHQLKDDTEDANRYRSLIDRYRSLIHSEQKAGAIDTLSKLAAQNRDDINLVKTALESLTPARKKAEATAKKAAEQLKKTKAAMFKAVEEALTTAVTMFSTMAADAGTALAKQRIAEARAEAAEAKFAHLDELNKKFCKDNAGISHCKTLKAEAEATEPKK